MQEYRNLKELMSHLSDEKVCQNYMEELRWNGKPTCPHCDSEKPYRLKNGKTFRCSNRNCRKDFTVTVGTIFEKSLIPYSTWLAAIWLITGRKKGTSSCQLARDLGVTQKTAWFIFHRIRFIMGDHDEPGMLDNIVEIDETYVGGKVGNMHKGKRKKIQDSGKDNKVPVMGLIERGGTAKLTVIGQNTFKDVVRQNVDKDALVITDSHLSYIGLSQEYAGHESVNHSRGEYKRDIFHTNTIEGFFSHFKRTIFGTYHQISPKHLQAYCDESNYRYNTRELTDKQRFVNALSNTEGRLTYKNLIQKP
jgi:transposase-like protein